MKSVEWKTYRTRFLVKAKQLSSSLSFVDHMGRQHGGRKGDYLVESCDGVLSIAPRQIFEDIYVPMSAHNDSESPAAEPAGPYEDTSRLNGARVATPRIERVRNISDGQFRRSVTPDKSVRTVRKSPQPIRVNSSRLSLM